MLDASALIAFATGRPVYVRALVWAAVEANIVLAVPSAALSKAWSVLSPSTTRPSACCSTSRSP